MGNFISFLLNKEKKPDIPLDVKLTVYSYVSYSDLDIEILSYLVLTLEGIDNFKEINNTFWKLINGKGQGISMCVFPKNYELVRYYLLSKLKYVVHINYPENLNFIIDTNYLYFTFPKKEFKICMSEIIDDEVIIPLHSRICSKLVVDNTDIDLLSLITKDENIDNVTASWYLNLLRIYNFENICRHPDVPLGVLRENLRTFSNLKKYTSVQIVNNVNDHTFFNNEHTLKMVTRTITEIPETPTQDITQYNAYYMSGVPIISLCKYKWYNSFLCFIDSIFHVEFADYENLLQFDRQQRKFVVAMPLFITDKYKKQICKFVCETKKITNPFYVSP